MEEKKIIPETQAGFRNGRSTIDNIFIMNYIVNRELQNKGGKIYTFFADLSAAFDKVNRNELGRVMERNGISQNLRTRIKEIYKETRNVIRVNGKTSQSFWTTRRGETRVPIEPDPVHPVHGGSRGSTAKRAGRKNSNWKRIYMVTGICRHCFNSKNTRRIERNDRTDEKISRKKRS